MSGRRLPVPGSVVDGGVLSEALRACIDLFNSPAARQSTCCTVPSNDLITATELMTTTHQKCLEQHYAERLGEVLVKSWKVTPSPDEDNWPDLIVKTERGRFGLEVTELYLDKSPRNGSKKKANEAFNRKRIKKLAGDYYRAGGPTIRVVFRDSIDRPDIILRSLISVAPEVTECELKRIKPYPGCRIDVRRLPDELVKYDRWDPAFDRGGMVANIDEGTIQAAIDAKAQKLPKYACNIKDVRLLLVSDRTHKSSLAHLVHNITCDLRGFSEIYYYSFPYNVWELTASGSINLTPDE